MGLLGDIANGISSAVGAVGDAVEGAVDAVTGAAGDVIDALSDGIQGGLGWLGGWLCRNAGDVGCRIGNVVLGGLSGLIEGARDLADAALGVVKDAGGAIGALLRGDIAGFLGKLGEVVLGVVDLIVNAVRFVTLGTIIGGVVDAWQAADLRRFVEDLVDRRFEGDPARLGRVREHLGLGGVSWGLPLRATHRVFRIDSDQAPLWQWHEEGLLDLYAMAGVASFDSFNVNRRRTIVRVTNREGTVESSLPANRWQIAKFLESRGRDVRLRVYALSADGVKDAIQTATAKCKKLGIKLSWDQGGRFDYFGVPLAHDVTTREEVDFDRSQLGRYLVEKGLREGTRAEQCELLAMAAFRFEKGLGVTSGRAFAEGDAGEPCAVTPGRTDRCCVSVIANRWIGAGVLYHDEWPARIFRYVLGHEIGHYVGLCHYGHDGFQNMMFTPEEGAKLSYRDLGLFRYYLDDEPSFTLDDAKNTWRFLVTELSDCLDPMGEPGPIP